MPDSKLTIVINAKDKASRQIGGVTAALGKVGKFAGGVAVAGLGAFTIAAGAAAAAAIKLAADAAAIEGVKNAFEDMAETAGTSSDVLIQALQEASAGMISNADLMKAYNSATLSIGETFANTLPDAMEYLGKVSAATGKDMGYLLDSLVTGVAKLSPMILDNLDIQVDLNTAYEAWADSMGVAVSEMSKADQQAAVTAEVMRMLAANTAELPEVTDSASAAFGGFKTQLTNLKDEVGLALLPVMTPLLSTLGGLAEDYLPGALEGIENMLDPLVRWVNIFASAQNPLEGLKWVLTDLFGGETANAIVDGISNIATWFGTLKDNALALINDAMIWLQEKFDTLSDWWAEHGPGLKESADELFTGLIEAGQELAGKVLDFILTQVDKFTVWLDENGPLIEDFAALVAEKFGVIADEVVNAWDVISPLLDSFLTVLLDLATLIMQIATGDWENAWGTMVKITEESTGAIEQFFLDLADMVTAWFDTDWATVETKWEYSWGEMKTYMKAFINEIPALWVWLVDELISIGEDIVDGLISGIVNKWTDLTATVSALLLEFIDWIRMLLGMESPSKVFAEIGRNMVLGMAEGFDEEWANLKRTVSDKVNELFDMGRVFSGLGGFAASLYKSRVIDPLTAQLEALDAKIAAIKEGGVDPLYEAEELLKLEAERVELAEEYAEAQARALELRKQQENLAFLQQQFALLELIKEYGLDASKILGGLEFGVDASLESFIEAMTRAIALMVQKIEEELEIESPSKVFARIGAQLMQGMAEGIQSAAMLPALAGVQAVGGVVQSSSRSSQTTNNLNIYTNAESEPIVADFYGTMALSRA